MEYKGNFTTTKECLLFIEESLGRMKISGKDAKQALMYSEHALYHLLEGDEEGKEISILLRKTFLFTDIRIEVPGKRIDINEECQKDGHDGENYSEVIAKTFHKSFHNIITYRYSRHINRITIPVEDSGNKELITTLCSLVAGIVFGLICRLAFSSSICEKIDYYCLDLFKTIFMNALKVILGPIVFFSLASCVSRYTNLRTLGRISIKTMGLYLFTTFVAILIGFALFTIHPIGDSGMLQARTEASEESADEESEELDEMMVNYENADFSIRHLIASMMPENIVDSFLQVNLLQIIIFALMIGIAVSRCGEHAVFLSNLIESFNRLFSVLTSIITRFIPVAIFCSMAELVMNMGLGTLLTILTYAVMVILGMLCMIGFYCIFIFVSTGLSPFTFLKKFSKAMMTAFAVSSGPATMPTSLSCCREMGIDDKISSFTIPLGTNVNMDGSCMVFILTVLFTSRIYGINLSTGMLASIAISIVFLALGSPTVAGADIVIIAVLLAQVGVPVEAVGLILGIDAIFDMVQAVSNTTGDAAVTLVVAKSENMLDVEKYKS